MRVLLTGQVGLDKASYLEASKRVCEESGARLTHVSIGRWIVENSAGRLTDANVLDQPKYVLQGLRERAWGVALEEVGRADPREVFVVNSHAVLRWKHGLIPALDLDTLNRFGPEMIMTLIDDVDLVQKGLVERGTSIFQLWELLAWREEEIHTARLLCDTLERLTGRSIPFFLIPKKQGPDLFARLVTNPGLKKAYLSFPVTGLPPDQKEQVDKFKVEVASQVICFDPLALGERAIKTTAMSLSQEAGKAIMPGLSEIAQGIPEDKDRAWKLVLDDRAALGLVEFHTQSGRLLGREVVSILDAIDDQIIARDYMLIEQSDMLIAFIPAEEDGTGRISAGSQSEIVYAFHRGKPVYIIFPGNSAKLSPWVTEHARRVFSGADGCLAELARL